VKVWVLEGIQWRPLEIKIHHEKRRSKVSEFSKPSKL